MSTVNMIENRSNCDTGSRVKPKRASPYHVWNKCAGCRKRIRSRYLLTALGRTWHENCLTCDLCNEILYSFGDPCLFYKDGFKLCKKDYSRLHLFIYLSIHPHSLI